ncbi:hypothetical protein LTR15_011922 [Elasticomyces elasticus]|nr:hypothetical protein LTR15_011922 [Elasticomyces elasticus]
MSGESSPLTEPEPGGDEYTNPKAGDITALLLERLSRHVMDAHINILQPGNVEFLKTYGSPEYRMVNPTDHEPGATSEQALETHLKNYVAFRKPHRPFWTEVTSTSATFNGDRSIAKVLVTAHGNVAECWHAMIWAPDTRCDGEKERYFKRESINLYYWRQRPNWQWQSYQLMTIRGGLDSWNF